MPNRIDFTDRSVPQVYEDMAQSCVLALDRFYSEMEVLCRTHSYKPMVDFTNAIQRFYAEEFQQFVMRMFHEWEDGDYSLSQLALRVGAGQGAAATGRHYMDELEDRLQGMFRRSFSPIQVDTDAPVLKNTDIEKIDGYITSFLRSAETAKENAITTIQQREEENAVYCLIKPVISSTGESLCNCFRSMLRQVAEGSELFSGGITTVIGRINPSMRQEVDYKVQWPKEVPFT